MNNNSNNKPSSETSVMNCNSENHDMHLENHHSYVRKRTRATAEQLAVLEDTFAVNVSPNSKLRKQLAEQLSMSERSIQIWFQNRRAKVKHMQKRAQMQMQQAAIRAQLYHYHQQQFGMMSPYGAAPPPPMLPLQSSLYTHQQQATQQPFFFPPPYMRRVPLPRAQSVDAVSYYGSPAADMARSSFPTPGPEPFLSHDSVTPPPHMAQQQPYSLTPASSWSVSPNYPMIDSPTKISRQSMPPYNPLSHTLVDEIMPTGQNDFGEQVNSADTSNKVLSEDFPDFVHGQMSPSPSPNRDDINHNASYFPPSGNSESALKNEGSTADNKAECGTFTKEPVSINESDMWISSPNATDANTETVTATNASSSTTANASETPSISGPSEKDATVNPSNLMMASSNSSALPDQDSTDCHYFNTTTLTIGTWHRLKLHSSDLLCLYKESQNAFIWFITEGGCRFKVEIPLSNMVSIEYASSLGSNGESICDIHFYMSQPPLFYMETSNEKEKQWIQCSDFTENKQASRYLRHTLKGPQLKQDLLNLMNEKEDLHKMIRFLDANSSANQINVPSSSSLATPFLPSQQNTTMVVPTASYYPASSYYCYSGVSTASMPLPLGSNPSSMVAGTESPVAVGGFYP